MCDVTNVAACLAMLTWKGKKLFSLCIVVSNVINTERFPVEVENAHPTIWQTLRSSCKMPNIFVQFDKAWGSSTYIFFKSPVSNFTKIQPVGTPMTLAKKRTDGLTDIHYKANRCLSQLTWKRIEYPDPNWWFRFQLYKKQ